MSIIKSNEQPGSIDLNSIKIQNCYLHELKDTFFQGTTNSNEPNYIKVNMENLFISDLDSFKPVTIKALFKLWWNRKTTSFISIRGAKV